jgi:hypothetical protein
MAGPIVIVLVIVFAAPLSCVHGGAAAPAAHGGLLQEDEA